VLSPGLRVAYAVAPPLVAGGMALLKQAADLHTSTLTQRAVLRLVTTPGFLDDHLARVVPVYEARARALTAALEEHVGDAVRFVRPDGGMFVWCDLLDDVDTDALLHAAVERGVAFVPGSAFAIGSDLSRSLRLSFATVTPSEIDEGIRRLDAALPATDRRQRAQV
jgi:2-aminoadipate transaminase